VRITKLAVGGDIANKLLDLANEWNSLSIQLRKSDITLGQGRRALKTHQFSH